MVVRTNVFALNAHRNMKNVGLEQSRASNRLSSGYRINSAADDAAGLAISETMRAQIRGLDQASRNSQDGQAMLQTTEGGLEEIGNMLQRVRELIVQASNDTNTQDQRTMIEQEIAQLGQEISSMQQRVEFNTNRVLAMGPEVDFSEAIESFAEGIVELAEAYEEFSEAREEFDEARAEWNAAESAWLTAQSSGDPEAIAEAAEEYAEAAVEFGEALEEWTEAQEEWREAQDEWSGEFAGARSEILGEFRSASSNNHVAWFQVGANADQGIQFDFETVSRVVAVSGALVSMVAQGMVTLGTHGDGGVGHGEALSSMASDIQTALDELNSVRANLGAVQNRMDYTMRSLDVSSENLSDSESRVRNADMAREMMRFTMSNVLQQASISMLSQANQMPNNLLQILR